MQLLRSYQSIPAELQGGILTVGHFDGVHCGHQQLLKAVVSRATTEQVPAIVLTFEPHAVEFFQAAETPRLSRWREKYHAFSSMGIDGMMILKFNQMLASLSASDFILQIIYGGLRPKHIVIGDDFRFGYKRQGDSTLLKQMGEKLGFTVSIMPTLKIAGERVSSSRIRQALINDELTLAQTLLGHRYYMLGRVGHGDKRGSAWGFPTINIPVHRAVTAMHGIYTVYVHGLTAMPVAGVASIGTRPTVGGKQTLLEVHLLDFDDEVYGHHVKVEFCEKLRDEICYANIALLKAQIAIDVRAARDYFKKMSV